MTYASRLLMLAGLATVAAVWMTAQAGLAAAGAAALTGQVSSQAEGTMEGVVISARQAGGIMTVAVPGLKARRGRIDHKDDKFYFGEYLADKKGRFYAPSNGFERFFQIEPKNLPIDNSGPRPVLWMTNKRTARVTRVEPLG